MSYGAWMEFDFGAAVEERVIPIGTPCQVAEKVSWWRFWRAKTRNTVWPPEPVNLVSKVRFAAPDAAYDKVRVWMQERFR